MERPVIASLQRVWLALIQLALLLPFATVQDCNTHETHTFTGLEVYFSAQRLGLFMPLGFGLLILMLFPWTGGRSQADAVGVGLRSWIAGLCAISAAVGPAFAFLFDGVEPHIGWYLHGGAWGLTALMLLGLAVFLLVRPDDTPSPGSGPWSRPELVGVGLLAAVPLGAAGIAIALDPSTVGQLLPLAGMSLASQLPLIVTGLSLARAIGNKWPMSGQRALWWLGAIAALASHLGPLVDG